MGNTASSDVDEDQSIYDKYNVGEMLGSGSFGQVRTCEPYDADEDGHVASYAVKIVDRAAMVATQAFLTVEDEIDIMRKLDHRNVLRLIETFEDDRFLYIVMERLDGGELFQAIGDPRVTVREADVARVGRDLFSALEYLHESGVVHRDVKAENVLLEEPPEQNLRGNIKLIDFGLAATYDKGKCPLGEADDEPLDLFCGSPLYVAPEIFHTQQGGHYGAKVDVWASGVLLHLALYGQPPFWAGPGRNSVQDLEPVITSSEGPAFQSGRSPGWQPSQACVDCLSELLAKDPQDRLSASEAKKHKWLLKTRGVSLGADGMVPAEVRAQALVEVQRKRVSLATEQERTAAFEALKHGSAR